MTDSPVSFDRNPWSHFNKRLAGVQVEDDIRDALQSVRCVRPDFATRRTLVRHTASIGVAYSFVGFPAASAPEQNMCTDLVRSIGEDRLGITPVVMARAVISDVDVVARTRDVAGHPVLADIYVPTSAIRARVEGWTLSEMLTRLYDACARSRELGVPFRVALEDSTRTNQSDMREALDVVIAIGPTSLVLNDTAGDCLPDGAARHVAFAVQYLSDRDAAVQVAWHGHNDKGLTLGNALAAANAGADLISGTFTGVGERTGNVPLEQLMYVLAEAGNESFDLGKIPHVCATYAQALGVDISPGAPLIGRDAFSTATGTHAAAIVKAQAMSDEVTDLVYSGVEARRLGRRQSLLIGPGSGRAAVKAVLSTMEITAQPGDVDGLLDHCQRLNACLNGRVDVLRALDQVRHQYADRHR